MNIAVVGSGYVGTTTAAVFARRNQVICVDIDQSKVDAINQGRILIKEPGLEDLVTVGVKQGRLRATSDMKEAMSDADICFICVGTPSGRHGEIDLSYVKKAIDGAVDSMRDKYVIFAIRSTVIPGTTEGLLYLIQGRGKQLGKNFGMAMVPEFLREGSAVHDFMNPDRVVIGYADEMARDKIIEIYKEITDAEIYTCGLKEAEMIKYMANSYLAMSISFANEMANLCNVLGIDYQAVKAGVQLDSRIGPKSFLTAGIGFGGSCFLKDVEALHKLIQEKRLSAYILDATLGVNSMQPTRFVNMMTRNYPREYLNGKTIGVLGLAFNPNTDDVRETRSAKLIEELLRKKARVLAHDPLAKENFRREYPELAENVQLLDSAQETVDKSDIVVVATAWPEYLDLNFNETVVYEGRPLFPKEKRPEGWAGRLG